MITKMGLPWRMRPMCLRENCGWDGRGPATVAGGTGAVVTVAGGTGAVVTVAGGPMRPVPPLRSGPAGLSTSAIVLRGVERGTLAATRPGQPPPELRQRQARGVTPSPPGGGGD